MITNITGLSRDLIIHPGETLEECLENKGITKSELADLTGYSKVYITNVINGKKDISAKFAIKLAKVFGDDSPLFLNLQTNYDYELALYEEFNSNDRNEEFVFDILNKNLVFKNYKQVFSITSDQRIKIQELRKFLGVGNLQYLNKFARGNFRLEPNQEINEYVLGAFVRIADNTTRAIKLESDFDRKKIDNLIRRLTKIRNNNLSNPLPKIKEVFAQFGIAFEILENFKVAPALGYISKRLDGKYGLIVTINPKEKRKFWFTLFHELGHLYNRDLIRNKAYLDFESYDGNIEDKANDFANKCLLVKSHL